MDWAASLAAPATRWFLIVQPHPLVPDALLPGIRGPAAANAGLTGAEVLDDRGGTAEIWRVDPPVAGAYIRDLPLHLDAPAALAWLARHPADGARELGDAGAVVDTTDPTASDELLEALAGEACSRPAGDPYPAGWLRLARAQPDGTCPTASLTNA